MTRWIGAIALLCIVMFGSFKQWERQIRLSYVPDSLNVSKVLYVNEELWGFGPGGNETGVIVYELPNDVAMQIKKAGISYFAGLPPKVGNGREWHGHYHKWQSTPIVGNSDWSDRSIDKNSAATTFPPKLANYLSKYGFGIAIDAKV